MTIHQPYVAEYFGLVNRHILAGLCCVLLLRKSRIIAADELMLNFFHTLYHDVHFYCLIHHTGLLHFCNFEVIY